MGMVVLGVSKLTFGRWGEEWVLRPVSMGLQMDTEQLVRCPCRNTKPGTFQTWENWQSGDRSTGICNCFSWSVSLFPLSSLFFPQLIAFVFKEEMIQHDVREKYGVSKDKV